MQLEFTFIFAFYCWTNQYITRYTFSRQSLKDPLFVSNKLTKKIFSHQSLKMYLLCQINNSIFSLLGFSYRQLIWSLSRGKGSPPLYSLLPLWAGDAKEGQWEFYIVPLPPYTARTFCRQILGNLWICFVMGLGGGKWNNVKFLSHQGNLWNGLGREKGDNLKFLHYKGTPHTHALDHSLSWLEKKDDLMTMDTISGRIP